MEKYIEINFGQRPEWIQHQIVPLSAIKTVFIDLPNETSIHYDIELDGKAWRRTEYFQSKAYCLARWHQLRNIFDVVPAYNALPDNDDEEA